MKDFITLLKVNLNVNFGLSAFRYRLRRERDKLPQTVLVMLAVGLAVGIMVSLYTFFMLAIYQSGVSIGSPDIILVLAFLGLQLFLLVTGVFYVISVFYYSKDLGNLVPLPVRPWQVLLSKFSVVMAYEYLTTLPILLPPVIIYGLGTGQDALYWIKAAVLIAVSPAIPLAIGSIIAIVLMRFFNLGKRKDLFAILGGSVAVAGIMSINLWTQRIVDSAGADYITRLLQSNIELINTIALAFPPSAWATFSLSGTGLGAAGYLLLFVAVSAALVGAMLWLSDKLYYKSVLSGEEVSRNKPSKLSKAAVGRESSAVLSLYVRELRMLLRTPAYALNCLVGSLLIPIIVPLSLLQSKDGLAGITLLLQDPQYSLPATLGAVGLLLLTSIINVTASTCLSREGKVFWMARMIPVSPQHQIYAKFLVAYTIAALGMLLSFLVLILFFHYGLAQAMLVLFLGALGSIPITAVSMAPDILRPKLQWANPYEAVKQNLNVLIAMLASSLLIGIVVLLVLGLAALHLPPWALYGVLVLFFAALAWASDLALKALSKSLLKHEV